MATVSTGRDCPSVRNSLPIRSSLNRKVIAWVLKAEIGRRDDKSNEKDDDNGLYR